MVEAMESSEKTIILGQGVTDFKGIFGSITGLAERFPDRVIETPIAEDSVAGMCIGAALNGLYPINTHIRADFGLLLFNQLINLAAKYRYMFGGLFEVPLMMRMVIGRSWGQGAQHSQSLQSLLAHIPGLTVVMPSSPASILPTYRYAINHYRNPVIMLEHRLMYELEFDDDEKKLPNADCPVWGSILIREGRDISIVATSVMVLEAKRAAKYLEGYGISLEIIDLHSISHPDNTIILNSVKKTRKLIVADTSWKPYGVSAEICRLIAESIPEELDAPVVTLGMCNTPCPTAKALEDMFYPELHQLVGEIIKLHNRGRRTNIPMPPKESMTDFYKHFKGPF